MTQIETQSPTFHAPVDQFILFRNKALTGPALKDIQAIETSLLKFGLLSPLTAIRNRGQLVVIDGRKRLVALRRLAFDGRLPASLTEIPYVISGTESAKRERRAPTQLQSETCYRTISRHFEMGKDVSEISETLAVSHQMVRRFLSLHRLAPAIRRAFFQRLIDFDVAQAYATHPSQSQQLILFYQLGLHASVGGILDGVKHEVKEALAA